MTAQSFTYSTFGLPGGGDAVGGISDDTQMPGEAPAHWLTWFQTDDTDGSIATATDLGASVVMPADDSPFGRMAVIRAPQGEVFGLIDRAAPWANRLPARRPEAGAGGRGRTGPFHRRRSRASPAGRA